MAKVVPYAKLKDKLLQPALSTHYTVDINYNQSLASWINEKFKSAFNNKSLPTDIKETLSILCCDATIPGSTFFTHEVQNDRTGVTEKIPYRRVYDDQASFTFNVDSNYTTLAFFEGWMSYIANEQYGSTSGSNSGISKKDYFYRMRYPDEGNSSYKVDMILTKFERNHVLPQNLDSRTENVREIKYHYMDVYPLAINSIPVSYESASPLKVTVSFAFTRYYIQ